MRVDVCRRVCVVVWIVGDLEGEGGGGGHRSHTTHVRGSQVSMWCVLCGGLMGGPLP